MTVFERAKTVDVWGRSAAEIGIVEVGKSNFVLVLN
jgi:hypothetical protein